MGNEKMTIEQTEAEVVRDVKHVINRLKLDDYIQRINSGMMKSQSGFPVRMAKKARWILRALTKRGALWAWSVNAPKVAESRQSRQSALN